MLSALNLLLTLFLQIFAQESNKGEPKDVITGFLNEPLHLDCSKKRTEYEEDFVTRKLSEYDSSRLNRFVSSRWEQGNYTKHCNEEHSLYDLCSSQVTSYVTNNQVTHFVIKSAPSYLNGSETLCEYGGLDPSSQPQIIKLQGRIKGYVNGRIEMKCPIPYRCKESESVNLKLNLTEVKTVDVNHENSGFPCIENEQYYNLCQDHMNSSYVNGSCSVIFVFERTPVSLNNTHLHCHVKFADIRINSSHDDIETIIFLQYQQNETTTTSPPIIIAPPKEKNIPPDNKDLSTGGIVGFIIGTIIAVIVIGFIVWRVWKRYCKCNQQPTSERAGGDMGDMNQKGDLHTQQPMLDIRAV